MAFVPAPMASGIMSDFMIRQRMDALRRKQLEQGLLDQEHGALVASGAHTTGSGHIPDMYGNLIQNDPHRPTDPSGHYPMPKTIGGSGIPTAGGVTQIGATTDVGGGIHSAPTNNFSFDPMASLNRIGNAKDEFGNVIMAPPAVNSAPNMGRVGAPDSYPGMGGLTEFDKWNSGRPGFTGASTAPSTFQPVNKPDAESPVPRLNPALLPEGAAGAPATEQPSFMDNIRKTALNTFDFGGYLNNIFKHFR